jgi:hypothetical protein
MDNHTVLRATSSAPSCRNVSVADADKKKFCNPGAGSSFKAERSTRLVQCYCYRVHVDSQDFPDV